ncbi:MAG: hypothetical protein ACYDFU_04955 [Nitrospirota bacterium]
MEFMAVLWRRGRFSVHPGGVSVLQYFFRGQIDAVDAATTTGTDDSGNSVITGMTLKVKNNTPNEDIYAVNNSHLVVSYSYQDGTGSTVYGKSGDVNLTGNIPSGNDTSTDKYKYTFTFSNPIPSGSTVQYMLVYRGRLGLENDAVAAKAFQADIVVIDDWENGQNWTADESRATLSLSTSVKYQGTSALEIDSVSKSLTYGGRSLPLSNYGDWCPEPFPIGYVPSTAYNAIGAPSSLGLVLTDNDINKFMIKSVTFGIFQGNQWHFGPFDGYGDYLINSNSFSLPLQVQVYGSNDSSLVLSSFGDLLANSTEVTTVNNLILSYSWYNLTDMSFDLSTWISPILKKYDYYFFVLNSPEIAPEYVTSEFCWTWYSGPSVLMDTWVNDFSAFPGMSSPGQVLWRTPDAFVPCSYEYDDFSKALAKCIIARNCAGKKTITFAVKSHLTGNVLEFMYGVNGYGEYTANGPEMVINEPDTWEVKSIDISKLTDAQKANLKYWSFGWGDDAIDKTTGIPKSNTIYIDELDAN